MASTTRVQQVEAFFRSLPELKTHFTQAAARHPANAQPFLFAVEALEDLSRLPAGRAKRTNEQQQASMTHRQKFAIALQTIDTQPQLKYELTAVDQIVAKNVRPENP